MRSFAILITCVALIVSLRTSNWAQEPNTNRLILAGETLNPAILSDVSSDGKLIFQSTNAHREAELSSIVRWIAGKTIQPTAAVWLSDGSWLSGSIQWLGPSSVKLNSEWFESIEFKLDDLRGILLHPSPAYRPSIELQSKMAALSGSSDTLWNKDYEQLQGVLSIEWRAGSAIATGRPAWFLKSVSGDRIELRDSDLMAVVFSPVLRKPLVQQPEFPVVTMRDGSRLRISKLKRSNNQRLQVELSDGFTLDTLDSIDQYLPSIAAIHAVPENVSWLSDLEPARYRLIDSASALSWPLGRDADLYGKPLWVEGLPAYHSLVIHSPAQVAYRWDGRAARLLCEVQLLDSQGTVERAPGSARCEVLVARQGELKSVHRSEVMRHGDAPQQVDVDIEGAQLVVLLVEESDQGPMGDHVLWREARFTTPAGR